MARPLLSRTPEGSSRATGPRSRLWLAGALAGATAIGAALSFARSHRNRDEHWWRGKVVLITGGSRGLGLALARELALRGSRLVLCARHPEELEVAMHDLTSSGASVITIPCDVTDRRQVESMIDRAIQHFGRIDVLINNAGLIQVGPLHTMTLDDFRSAMDVMFWGVVHTSFAALPHMRERGQGRIVNITSVGGKVSVPHLLPYCCAKFAAAGFSEGMRAELHGSGVKVVTIAPGLMRTGSYLNAVFKGAEGGEAAWFSISASLPGLSMSADRAARQIIRAAETGRAECILSVPANLLARVHGLFPGVTADMLGLINGVLPGNPLETKSGAQTHALNKPWLRVLTTLGRKAAVRYLQPERGLSAAEPRIM